MKIRLTENKLKQIIAESVNKVLNENITEGYWNEVEQLLTNLYDWTKFYEEEFEKANIEHKGNRYSMWCALEEMQNIIGQLNDLKERGRRMYN